MRTSIAAIVGLAAVLAAGSAYATPVTAYKNATGVSSIQSYRGSLGMDFTVNRPVAVTAIGAFDNGSIANLDGARGNGVTVAIYDITSGPTQVSNTLVHFTPATPGLIQPVGEGDAFLTLTSPIILSAGTYSIVSFDDRNYNVLAGTSNPNSTEDSGGGAISFVGAGRYLASSTLTFPTTIAQGHVTNHYDAGTFQFVPVPEPASLALLGVGLLGLGLIRYKRA